MAIQRLTGAAGSITGFQREEETVRKRLRAVHTGSRKAGRYNRSRRTPGRPVGLYIEAFR